jgi:hypothetical protein
MLVNKKMKLFQLVIISAFLATLIIPVANADITVQSVNLQDVVASTPPLYGSCRFNIVCVKTTAQDESVLIPVIVNGTRISDINVNMKANEMSRIVSANVTLPGGTILMTNPFAKARPIPANLTYVVAPDPWANPISSVQYNIKVGAFSKNITLLIYADWTIWAIIIDIVAMAAAVFFITRSLMA